MTDYKFLSEEWFAQVKDLRTEIQIELPEKLQAVVVNVLVADEENDGEPINAVYRGCWFEPGTADDATATLLTTRELAYEVMIQKNLALGVRAISTGKARIKGDRRKLLALRAVRPSPSQEAFDARVKEITVP